VNKDDQKPVPDMTYVFGGTLNLALSI